MEKFNRKKFKDFWVKLWSLLRPVQRPIKVLSVFIVIDELAQLVGPYLFKLIIDRLILSGIEELLYLLALIGLMFLVHQFVIQLGYIEDRRIFNILVDVEKHLNERAMAKMVNLSLGYHEKNNTGSKVSRIQRGVDKVGNLLADSFWQVGPTLIQVAMTLAILFWIDWRFGLVFSVFAPIFVAATLRLNRLVHPLRKARHDEYEHAAGKMAEAIININTVKSYAQERREVREFRGINEKIKNNALKEFFLMLKYNFGRSSVINLGRVTMIGFGIFLVTRGMITIGSLVFVITISEKALLSLYRITRLYDRIMESSEAIERLSDLDKEMPDIKNPINGLKPKSVTGRIIFKNVYFSYPGHAGQALQGVNFEISAGCITALVGPSGGGKSTVARLIYRHYDPERGRISLDGADLKDYDLYCLRRFMAIVPQDVEIFDMSIRANIAYAHPRASLKEIKAAARIANADEFIEQLPQGYDAVVGERGIKLSGGQKQRVGIARAVLANPRILIFDEATSHLDSESEAMIKNSLEKISKGRTVVIIAHRLSTVMKADKIIVLDEGRVSEQGNHIELARNHGGIYSRLTRLQNLVADQDG